MTYTDPKLEIVRLEQNNVITTSDMFPPMSVDDDKF